MASKAPKGKVKLIGIDEVMRNFQREVDRIENKSMEGLIRCTILIRRDMEKTPPLVPVDTGNLRASWFTVTSTGLVPTAPPAFLEDDNGKLSASYNRALSQAKTLASASRQPIVIMGFGANYAVFTHEDLESTFKRPGSGPKYLESALQRNREQMLFILRNTAKIQ